MDALPPLEQASTVHQPLENGRDEPTAERAPPAQRGPAFAAMLEAERPRRPGAAPVEVTATPTAATDQGATTLPQGEPGAETLPKDDHLWDELAVSLEGWASPAMQDPAHFEVLTAPEATLDDSPLPPLTPLPQGETDSPAATTPALRQADTPASSTPQSAARLPAPEPQSSPSATTPDQAQAATATGGTRATPSTAPPAEAAVQGASSAQPTPEQATATPTAAMPDTFSTGTPPPATLLAAPAPPPAGQAPSSPVPTASAASAAAQSPSHSEGAEAPATAPPPEHRATDDTRPAPCTQAPPPPAPRMSATPESMLFTWEFDAAASRGVAHAPTATIAPSLLSQLAEASRTAQKLAPMAVPDEVRVIIHDSEGDIHLTVGRDERDVAVKVEVPNGLMAAVKGAEAPIRGSLHEDGYELQGFDVQEREAGVDHAPKRDPSRHDEPTERRRGRPGGAANPISQTPTPSRTHGPRLLDRHA